MPNASYTNFKNGIQTGKFDLMTATIKVGLYRNAGSPAMDIAHVTMADFLAAGWVANGTPVALTSKNVAGGIFSAADSAITTTANGSNHYIIVFQSSPVGGGGDAATSGQLLCFYFDTGTNLPIVPGTGTVNIAWAPTGARIYKIG